ncbi:hypothetical protein QWZ10_10310 [Paracoccus cavernae]|uniref:Uncharacterized protein n=1 Tax=Paracoccus cavernae TaxID=1571207 RepID=A0ABT8D845_9RHOB|nr:hypothetical protein [Paracoccus cavernae]
MAELGKGHIQDHLDLGGKRLISFRHTIDIRKSFVAQIGVEIEIETGIYGIIIVFARFFRRIVQLMKAGDRQIFTDGIEVGLGLGQSENRHARIIGIGRAGGIFATVEPVPIGEFLRFEQRLAGDGGNADIGAFAAPVKGELVDRVGVSPSSAAPTANSRPSPVGT